MGERICPVTGKECVTGICSSYECTLEKRIAGNENVIVDAINGFSLKIAQSYQLGTEMTLKLAEQISQYVLRRLRSK